MIFRHNFNNRYIYKFFSLGEDLSNGLIMYVKTSNQQTIPNLTAFSLNSLSLSRIYNEIIRYDASQVVISFIIVSRGWENKNFGELLCVTRMGSPIKSNFCFLFVEFMKISFIQQRNKLKINRYFLEWLSNFYDSIKKNIVNRWISFQKFFTNFMLVHEFGLIFDTFSIGEIL